LKKKTVESFRLSVPFQDKEKRGKKGRNKEVDEDAAQVRGSPTDETEKRDTGEKIHQTEVTWSVGNGRVPKAGQRCSLEAQHRSGSRPPEKKGKGNRGESVLADMANPEKTG